MATRRFEHPSGKFVETRRVGPILRVRSGRPGTAEREESRFLQSRDAAHEEYLKLVDRLEKAGYLRVPTAAVQARARRAARAKEHQAKGRRARALGADGTTVRVATDAALLAIYDAGIDTRQAKDLSSFFLPLIRAGRAAVWQTHSDGVYRIHLSKKRQSSQSRARTLKFGIEAPSGVILVDGLTSDSQAIRIGEGRFVAVVHSLPPDGGGGPDYLVELREHAHIKVPRASWTSLSLEPGGRPKAASRGSPRTRQRP